MKNGDLLQHDKVYNKFQKLIKKGLFMTGIPHEKINRCLTDINRCLTDIFKIKLILADI